MKNETTGKHLHLTKICALVLGISSAGCAGSMQNPQNTWNRSVQGPDTLQTSPSKNSSVLASKKSETKPPRIINGNWQRGACSLEGNTLKYSEGKTIASADIDFPLNDAYKLLCSDGFSVALTPKSIIVAVGGASVLRGDLILQGIAGQTTLSNFYILKIPKNDSVAGSGLIDNSGLLRVEMKSGRRITYDMNNRVEANPPANFSP